MAQPLWVKGITGNSHLAAKYSIIHLRIPGKDSKTGAACEAVLMREFCLVNGRKANMLIGTNIIAAKQCTIDLANLSITIGPCQTKVTM
jgi:hypothetical protein